jgi:hypothetical protein
MLTMTHLSRFAVSVPWPAARPFANHRTSLQQLISNPSLRKTSPIIPAITNSCGLYTTSIYKRCRKNDSKRTKDCLRGIQRRAFSQTTVLGRDHHFDTLKFVQLLKDEGFTEDQAVAMMKVLGNVIEER